MFFVSVFQVACVDSQGGGVIRKWTRRVKPTWSKKQHDEFHTEGENQ